ncbi:nitronate monooxygenase [Dethiosulfatibacter aminovorans DSM 17477]|uniref:Probable nitronate monooxygenase n=1 Tax=Dethiosulfatibacter aminovorans DSM 17477 TaxID=1121476 RepID=A0A1M6BXN1_9FIRM|nr:nitronate monooxygenase family protein [Dethiosulfatibacter aminovorans]SHI53532.1 nitronate monooxygenase [Dethiosulfatibacter aminovorans DSM 17477]
MNKMKKNDTRITRMLNVEYPLLCGGLYGLSESKLVSSICNAGGYAFLSSSHLNSKELLKKEIRKTRALTDKPFGVNLSLLKESKSNLVNEYIDAVIEENIPVVETAGNNPEDYIKKLKENGIKVLHKVVSPRHALKAEKFGADAIILVGYSAGGHPGMDEVGLFVNLVETLNCVQVPVIAAGGICSGRGMAAAMSAGAEAVLMGTAFSVTKESHYHENIKNKIIESSSTDTVVIFKSIRNAFRCVRNKMTEKILELEENNASPEELLVHLKNFDAKESYLAGDAENIFIPAGQAIGLIDSIKSCRELIENTMEEYKACI